MINFFFRGC